MPRAEMVPRHQLMGLLFAAVTFFWQLTLKIKLKQQQKTQKQTKKELSKPSFPLSL